MYISLFSKRVAASRSPTDIHTKSTTITIVIPNFHTRAYTILEDIWVMEILLSDHPGTGRSFVISVAK
jgi:hypothetical protein